MINYAHRGASEAAPENTMASFRLGLEQGANGIETDIHRTADGKLVLFHDDDFRRVPGCEGSVGEMTWAALSQMDFGSWKSPQFAGERMVLLAEFLAEFSDLPIEFAIELKDHGVERDTLEMIYRFGCQDKTIITSFDWASVQNTRELDESIRLGFLTERIDAQTLEFLLKHRIGQICPKASTVTPELVRQAKQAGLSVRAWGVKTVELMEQCLQCGVDGMTVNFPDILARRLQTGRDTQGLC